MKGPTFSKGRWLRNYEIVIKKYTDKIFKSSIETMSQFQPNLVKGSLGKEDLSLFKSKDHTFLHLEIITKLQKYIHEIKKSSPPEPLGHF